MSDCGFPTTWRFLKKSVAPIAAIVAMIVGFGLSPNTGLAHADLVRTDPPIDGLAISSPTQITLTFSEAVTTTSPAPNVTMLNAEGASIGDNPLSILASDDPRTLVLNVPDLQRGTYTVSWEATSATDGHTLNGVYAFRVGGGLPPGLATSSDDIPAAWAVVTRWITFLGASIAAGMLLFDKVFVNNVVVAPPWQRWRARLILGGAGVALTSTIAEPLVQWIAGGESFERVVDALPDGWWWRPALLTPLIALGLAIAYPMRGRIPSTVALSGAAMALGSLLGLVMTSHAAGRADDRVAAVTANALHQWSVALWTGGIAALVVWSIIHSGEDRPGTLRLRRFSNIAIVLVVAATVTGAVNAGFVFPFASEIRADGFGVNAFEPLWSSNYGVVLLIKLAILVVPVTLAIYHRSAVAAVGQRAASLTGGIAGKMTKSLRWEYAATMIVILGGSTIALSAPPPPSVEVPLERITLVAATSDEPEPDSLIVHMTVDPGHFGENTIVVRLTNGDGVALADDSSTRVVLDFTSLDHGTFKSRVGLQPAGDNSNTFQTAGLDLSLEGWWQIDARVIQAGEVDQVASFFTLLPDPNTQGTAAAPKPDTDPEAEALFETAYRQMLSWGRVRWTERLGSGNDALVLANFAVIDGGEAGLDAYTLELVYSGGFSASSSGTPPQRPTYGSRASITIGDRGWFRTANGAWLEQPPSSFSPPSEWGAIYAGSENHRMGVRQTIDGVELQAVTFYLPEQPTRAEAWFVWWIDPSTGNVAQVAMIARMHYMVWSYSDINSDFIIESPIDD